MNVERATEPLLQRLADRPAPSKYLPDHQLAEWKAALALDALAALVSHMDSVHEIECKQYVDLAPYLAILAELREPAATRAPEVCGCPYGNCNCGPEDGAPAHE